MLKVPQVRNEDAILMMEHVYSERLFAIEDEPLVSGPSGQPRVSKATMARYERLQLLNDEIILCKKVCQRAGPDVSTWEIMSILKTVLREEVARKKEVEAKRLVAEQKGLMHKPAPWGRVSDLVRIQIKAPLKSPKLG